MGPVQYTVRIYSLFNTHDSRCEFERKSSFINYLTVNRTGCKGKVWIIIAKNVNVGQKEAPFGVLEWHVCFLDMTANWVNKS